MGRKNVSMLAVGVLLLSISAITVRAAEAGGSGPETVFAEERFYETGISGVTMQGTGVLLWNLIIYFHIFVKLQKDL